MLCGPIYSSRSFKFSTSIPLDLKAYCTHLVIPKKELMIVPSKSNKMVVIRLPPSLLLTSVSLFFSRSDV